MKAPGRWIVLSILTVLLVLGLHQPAWTQQPVQLLNQVVYTYSDEIGVVQNQGVASQAASAVQAPLIDPLGQITGCDGEILSDYQGFSVGLYQPDLRDPTGGEIAGLEALTPTELPDIPDNGIAKGTAPNSQNSNPFFLTNSDRGTYNFLFDEQRGQLDVGKSYILLINPPARSIYIQRRVRITVTSRNGNLLTYRASSVDGKPISTTDDSTSMTSTVNIRDAERVGLSLSALNMNLSICQPQEIQIVKTGDRAAAEPGDTVIYRLLIRNLSTTLPVQNLVITDSLPLGFSLIDNSARGEFQGQPVNVTTTRSGSTVTLNLNNFALPPNQTVNLAYGVILTPDAIRGSGENAASVQGRITRTERGRIVRDGPSRYRLRVRQGILTDCGTIIGRVFVDRNFDGEQQPGETGVANAVLYLDDGTRITTDTNGLFSIANVLAGYRTATLDLSSLPNYAIAPNSYFIERNGPSRMVHLEPGGLVRMNFGVTPINQTGAS